MVKNPQKTALFNLTTYFYKESLMANISFGGEIGPSRPQNYGHAFLWRKSATSNFRDFFSDTYAFERSCNLYKNLCSFHYMNTLV